MPSAEPNSTDRRTFLQAGALAAASAATLAPGLRAEDAAAPAAKEKVPTLPRRTLGKTGVDITMLDYGSGGRSPGLDRLLRFAFASGIRTFDTAKVYGSEPAYKAWFESAPEVRKQIFLIDKDTPREPRQMIKMLDERLAAVGTDYIDLFFIHGFGDHHSLDDAINLIKGREFKETADAIRKSGKAKFIGFSTHHKDRAQIIQAAADGGIVDAIMLQYTRLLADLHHAADPR